MTRDRWTQKPAGAFLRSREQYGGHRDSLLSLSVARGVLPRDSDTGRAASEDLAGYRVVEPGDLVVNRLVARDGAFAVSKYDGSVSPAYWVLVADSTIALPEFLGYAFKSRVALAEVWRRSKDMPPAQFDLPWPAFKSLPVLLPPPSEQRAIADYLDHETGQIDALIAKQSRLIGTLRERRAAVVERLILGNLGLIASRLKHYVTDVNQGWSPQCYPWPADGIETWAVLKTGASNGGRFRPDQNKELPSDELPRPNTVVQRGQIVVSRASTRELVGSAAVVDGDYPRLMLSDKLYALTLAPHSAEPRFVAGALGTRRYRDLIEIEAGGTSPSMQNISLAAIMNLPLALPSLEQQRAAAAYLDEQTTKIDALIAKAERFIEVSKERRSALITAAVTGQIDVRGAA